MHFPVAGPSPNTCAGFPLLPDFIHCCCLCTLSNHFLLSVLGSLMVYQPPAQMVELGRSCCWRCYEGAARAV